MPRFTKAAVRVGLLLAMTVTAYGYRVEASYKVKVIPNLRVRMRDGVELAAKLVRPDEEGRFPAILGYTPYRRLMGIKDSPSEHEYSHASDGPSYFAQRGYAVLEFDVRGTGNSGGSTQEMYADAERQDGYDLVEWIAAQPWCNGNVGMWGASYGGVDTWQVAALHPPHLKAVIVRSGTEDAYLDWLYPGGVPRTLYIFGNYAPRMTASNFAPPDIELAGEKWSEIWEEHLQKNEPWSIGFIKHQLDGPYWRARSVRPDYERIRCPVFVIEGWADWYQTAELRAYSHLKVPKRALIGPWAHYWPENAFPGPRIDGRIEYLKWFDYWLKGIDTGVMKEPPVTLFVRQYKSPEPMYREDAGFWRHENEWPLRRTDYSSLYLYPEGRLSRTPYGEAGDERDSYTYNPAVGVMSGILGRGSVTPWAMPLDQRLDEAYSLTYTSPVLEKDLEATRDPRANLFVSSTADIAYFHVRLCDVAPDGVSKLVSDGGLNATHRASHAQPELLKPGQVYELNIPMKSMAYVFPTGHRIRVAISSADFHNAWPVSKPAVNAVHRSRTHASRIVIPVAPVQDPKLPAPDLKPSPNPLPAAETIPKPDYQVSYDLVNQKVTVRTANGASGSATFTVSMRKPAEAVMNATQDFLVSKPDMQVKVQAQCVTASDETSFRHLVEVEVTVNGRRHFDRSWSVQVPREMN